MCRLPDGWMPENTRLLRSAIAFASPRLSASSRALARHLGPKYKKPLIPTGREADATKPSWCHPTSSNARCCFGWRHYSSFRVRTGTSARESIPCHDNGGLLPASSYWRERRRSARGSQVHSAIASVSVLTWPDSLFCTLSLTFPDRCLAVFNNGRSQYTVTSPRSQYPDRYTTFPILA